MPDKETVHKAKADLRKGKSASTAAGEFVREEMHHIREGKHGARSTKQAIAIGLSKARRAGVPLKPPARGKAKASTRRSAARALSAGHRKRSKPSPRRSRAMRSALEREGRKAASHDALRRQAKSSAARRGHADLRRAARKAVRTKGRAGRVRAARKAAKTRARRSR